jgi:tRNA 2-selenouridine synthase
MTRILPIREFLETKRDYVIVDVRSPSEFNKGNIPGSINIPLFSDTERAIVGTCYKKEGHDKAVELGLQIVGPKLSIFVKEAKSLGNQRGIKIYCARGGMRSGSFAWLMETAGFKDVIRLKRGYKSFRNHVLDFFKTPFKLFVLSGMTGSGKTEILHEMDKMGLQVLDLEGFAGHRGSAFGAIGLNPEDSNQRYENNIFNKLTSFDLTKPVFVEDESRNVGKVLIPPDLYKQMETATRLVIELPLEIRAIRLAKEYTGYGDLTLLESVEIIGKKLSERYKPVIELIKEKNYQKAAELILPYYDKSYTKGLGRRDKTKSIYLNIKKDNPKEAAMEIKEKAWTI